MNYRQGLFRIYIVLSICWILAWLYLGINQSRDLSLTEAKRQELDSIVKTMMDQDETDDDIQVVVDDFRQKYGERSWSATLHRVAASNTVAIAFVPPLAGYAVAFLALPWIGRGFEAKKSG